MEKLEQLKGGRYTVGRQPILQPADAKTPFPATWDWRPEEQPLPKTRPEMKEASQSVSLPQESRSSTSCSRLPFLKRHAMWNAIFQLTKSKAL